MHNVTCYYVRIRGTEIYGIAGFWLTFACKFVCYCAAVVIIIMLYLMSVEVLRC